MQALGVIGLIVSIALIILAAYKGWNVFPISIFGGLIVTLTNGMNIWTAIATNYASGWMNWAGGYFVVFALGSMLGELMGTSGAAKSVAYKIADLMGAKNIPIAIIIIVLILTYGGINSFVVSFAVVPIAVVMCQEANIPRAVAIGAAFVGLATATQTALPGTPSTQNIIPGEMLGTSIYAAPAIGVVCSIIMVVLGAIYIVYSQKRAVAKGEGFIPIPQDNLGESKIRVPVPNFFLSILPIFVVIAVVFFTRKTLAAMTGVCLGLFAGCVIAFAVFWKRYPDKKAMINKGFSSSIIPLMSTAAILGYGSLVQASPAFQNVVAFAKSLTLNPYITTAIGVNIVAGVAGSSSGGERIFLQTMGQFMLDKGVPAEALHRIAAISSGGLDSLPHNGAVLAIMMVWGSNHKESYKNVFVVSVLIPLIATAVAVIMANIIYPIG